METEREQGVSEITGEDFRRVLGSFATGVTVITANTPDGPTGMAANSVTSVSLDPPLVLFCPAKASQTWPELRAAGRFCINVMAGHHEEVTRQFARKGADRFAGVAYTDRETGPALDDAVAWIECSLRDEHEAGDHTIVVANVLAIEAADDGEPLVFFRGRYGTFATPEA
jgi:flavin reductase (DIM6/NTAB) family NADH-FMN oxidoreductase RutF